MDFFFVLACCALILFMSKFILNEPFKINTTTFSDGLGLNPLLMNFWNIVHPPVIFLGYALCLIPMAIAIARISVLYKNKNPEYEGKEQLDKFLEFIKLKGYKLVKIFVENRTSNTKEGLFIPNINFLAQVAETGEIPVPGSPTASL